MPNIVIDFIMVKGWAVITTTNDRNNNDTTATTTTKIKHDSIAVEQVTTIHYEQ